MELNKEINYDGKARCERWQINRTDFFLRVYLFCKQAQEMVCFDTRTVKKDENGRKEWQRMQGIALKHCGVIK